MFLLISYTFHRNSLSWWGDRHSWPTWSFSKSRPIILRLFELVDHYLNTMVLTYKVKRQRFHRSSMPTKGPWLGPGQKTLSQNNSNGYQAFRNHYEHQYRSYLNISTQMIKKSLRWSSTRTWPPWPGQKSFSQSWSDELQSKWAVWLISYCFVADFTGETIKDWQNPFWPRMDLLLLTPYVDFYNLLTTTMKASAIVLHTNTVLICNFEAIRPGNGGVGHELERPSPPHAKHRLLQLCNYGH